MSAQTPDPTAVVEVLDLLDDLTRLIDRSAANGATSRGFHADHVNTRLRELRTRLARTHPRQRRPIPGDWYTDLALALGDTAGLPSAALTAKIDQLESALDRAGAQRRTRRWWPG